MRPKLAATKNAESRAEATGQDALAEQQRSCPSDNGDSVGSHRTRGPVLSGAQARRRAILKAEDFHMIIMQSMRQEAHQNLEAAAIPTVVLQNGAYANLQSVQMALTGITLMV